VDGLASEPSPLGELLWVEALPLGRDVDSPAELTDLAMPRPATAAALI